MFTNGLQNWRIPNNWGNQFIREDCLSGKLDNNGIVDISKFPNGVYQILIKFDDGNTIVKQFVKQ